MIGKQRLLIVDDDPYARDMLEALLQQQGYQVYLAVNGLEALELLKTVVPDAILLDVMMPEMDGVEVCQRIRASQHLVDVPIIMITALDDRDIRLAAIRAGADDFIQKPYDNLELKVRVRSITALSRSRKQRQYELQQERDRTRSILEALGEAVVVTNNAGIVEYINPACVELSGYTNDETIGKIGPIGYNTNLHPSKVRELQQTVARGNTWRGEVVNQKRDGSYYQAALTVAPIRDEDNQGKIRGMVSVLRDITAIKEAQHVKEKFISNVSHELRTPLSVLTLLSGNLDTKYERLSESQRRKITREIRDQSRLVREMIDSVLQLSHLDNSQKMPAVETLNLSNVLFDEVDKQHPLAEKKQQSLTVKGDNDVPVEINRNHVRQIVRNLINNAIKYTPEGGQISAECVFLDPAIHRLNDWPGSPELPAGSWAAIRVSDNGIGISNEQLPHIFGRFYRANSETSLPGAGLGLSIARELIQLHNGHIFISSALDIGATFAVYFPIVLVKTGALNDRIYTSNYSSR